MRKHFALTKPCPGVVNLIDLTDHIQQHVFDNRIYKVNLGRKTVIEEIKCLEIKATMLREKYDEIFYQKVVEAHLGRSHCRMTCCITDITTEVAHVEIKRWGRFIECIGQLVYYNVLDPKPELHAYMFDESCGTVKINAAVHGLLNGVGPKLKLFHFITSTENVQIVNYHTKEVVFDFRRHENK